MAYPADRLDAGEQVVLHAHPHGRVLVGPVLVFLAVLGAAGYVAALTQGAGARGWPLVAAVAAGLVGWLAVAPLVRFRTTHLVVTTRRLLVREGVWRPRTLDVPLDRITAVHARPTPLGRFLGHGALVVGTDTDGEVELVDVPAVERVAQVLQRAAAAR